MIITNKTERAVFPNYAYRVKADTQLYLSVLIIPDFNLPIEDREFI